ncbi:MAG: ATP-binding protein [Bacteroidetes bacterium]|nr:ATP-binding protein [Bacteroidota bacterium]MBU2505653.1 ATP-binding protein [Bacteroidota bacterium]
MQIQRYLSKRIVEDLSQKMVFIGGPRQVGKTTLAKELISKEFESSFYFNWDYSPDRKKIMKSELPGDSGLLIFDEIHKFKKWKTTIKGIFDTYSTKYQILITGSARLNIYRRGGDSLMGRYHYYTLHPFSHAEILAISSKVAPFEELPISTSYFSSELQSLYKFGGFPEVLIMQDERELRRWHNERLDRLFKEDIRDVENIRDINSIMMLGDLLPEKVASPLSINSIREDLEVSHRAISNWFTILETFYYHFRIYPFHSRKIRSLKKEPKLYLYDWSEVKNDGAKFENMIAVHLLKFVKFLEESEGYKITLNYLRNIDKKEVDFLISVNNKPWFAVEVKLNEDSPDPNLKYFRDRLEIPFIYQVIKKENTDLLRDGIRVISASKFLTGLI